MVMKLKIDAQSGLVEIEADEASFSLAASEAKTLIAALSHWSPPPATSTQPLDEGQQIAATSVDPNPDGGDQNRKRRRTGGGAKTANWKVVDKLLTEDQRMALREFYATKAPSSQNEQVAVLSAKLRELLGREGYDGNELYTAFQTVGVKTPANLKAVLGNMTAEGLGSVSDNKFVMNFKGDDLVKHDLPRKPKTK